MIVRFVLIWTIVCISVVRVRGDTAAQSSSLLSYLLYSTIAQDDDLLACTRQLSGQGSHGCHLPLNASDNAVIACAYNSSQLQQFFTINTNTASAPRAAVTTGYVLVLPFYLFTQRTAQVIDNSNVVSGVILFNQSVPEPLVSYNITANGTNTPPANLPLFTNFSTASPCPHCNFGLYSADQNRANYPWNPFGNSIRWQSFNKPIYGMLNTTQFDRIQQACTVNDAKQFVNYPLRSLDMAAFMFAGTTDSTTCLRRGYCTPLGGYSVWGSILGSSINPSARSIMIMAPLDAASLFTQTAIGAASHVIPMVTLLAIVNALKSSSLSSANPSRQLLFALFQGETLGFSGSQRFVRDVTSFQCLSTSGRGCSQPFQDTLTFQNLKMDQFDGLIELSHLAQPLNRKYYLHSDDANLDANNAFMSTLMDMASNSFGTYNLTVSNNSALGLPPGSLHSFLLQNRTIPHALIADHDTQYQHRFHDGDFDNNDYLNITQISQLDGVCQLANLTAKWLYRLAVGHESSAFDSEVLHVNVDCTLLFELYTCLTTNFACDLVQNYFNDTTADLPNLPSHSPGSVYTLTPIARFVYRFTAYQTAQTSTLAACTDSQSCGDTESCFIGKCLQTAIYAHPGHGPGIEYDFSSSTYQVVDSSLPCFTESIYDTVSLVIMDSPSPDFDIIEAVVGCVVLSLSICSVLAAMYTSQKLKLA